MNKLKQEPVALSRGAKKEIIDTYIKLHEGKIGMHWLWAAILRIVNGESEPDVMDDFGYQFMPTEKAVETAALIRAVKLPRWDVHQYDNLMEADASGEYIKVSDIQSLITEDDKDALQGICLGIAEAVRLECVKHKDNEPSMNDLVEIVDRVLEIK